MEIRGGRGNKQFRSKQTDLEGDPAWVGGDDED